MRCTYGEILRSSCLRQDSLRMTNEGGGKPRYKPSEIGEKAPSCMLIGLCDVRKTEHARRACSTETNAAAEGALHMGTLGAVGLSN